MVDGSVRFISDTIDCGDLNISSSDINTKTGLSSEHYKFSGQSLWGIWGAMGSVNGGENKTL